MLFGSIDWVPEPTLSTYRFISICCAFDAVYRISIYYNVNSLWLEYIKNPKSDPLRAFSEKEARDYMTRKTPPK